MSYSLEHEIGELKGDVKAVVEGQERLERFLRDFVETARADLVRHEDKDDENFAKLWKQLGVVENKLAYYAGGIAVIIALAELLLKK